MTDWETERDEEHRRAHDRAEAIAFLALLFCIITAAGLINLLLDRYLKPWLQ